MIGAEEANMSQLGIPRVPEKLNNDERIELILDLSRRLRLLDELLQSARLRREHSEPGACIVEGCDLQQDALASF
jgi:hypothetical protein